MLARALAFLFVLAFALNLPAQVKTTRAKVDWGPDQSMKDGGAFQELLGERNNATFLLMARKKDLFIRRMDGLKMAWQKPLDLELDKRDLILQRVVITQREVVVLASYYDKGTNENSLYGMRFDQESFAPVQSAVKLTSIPAEKQSNTGSFSIHSSPDGSKILVHVFFPVEKDVASRSRMEMYDPGMRLLWSQEHVLPYDSDEFQVESQRVDDDGSVVTLGVKYARKSEKRALKRENKATYEYHLLTLTGESAQMEDHPIVVGDKFLQDMTLSIAKTGDILCAGLYGNQGSFSVRGAFFLRLDRATKRILHESYKPFEDDFITSYMTERQAAKAKKKAERKEEELELPEFQLHDIVHRDDGGAVLLAEQYYMYTTTHTSSMNGQTYTTTVVHYVYNDVLVINISPAGDIEWAVKVPKRQHTTGAATFSGFALNVKGDKLYLVFNDSGENLFLKPGDKVKQFEVTGEDALVVLATVDRNGEVAREALFSPERRDVILRPMDCVELDNKDMFIYASRKNDYRFGLITFK